MSRVPAIRHRPLSTSIRNSSNNEIGLSLLISVAVGEPVLISTLQTNAFNHTHRLARSLYIHVDLYVPVYV